MLNKGSRKDKMDAHRRISIPKTGDIAPEFKCNSTEGEISLASFSGQNIVLYFYPKDMTPGCIIQAREFAELYSKFKEQDTVIIGVSTDNLASHIKFCEQKHIPYPLLVDTVGSLCDMYGVIKERRTLGWMSSRIDRTTFLIGKNRKILRVWYNVQPLMHAKRVLDTVSIINLIPA